MKTSFFILLLTLLLKLIILLSYYGLLTSEPGFHKLLGKDEIQYYQKSLGLYRSIKENGFLWSAKHYYNYTESRHFLFYFIASFFFHLKNTYLSFLIFKSLLYAGACTYLFKTCKILHGHRVATYAVICFFLYIPMQLISLSFLRDDIIFFCVLACIFYSVKWNGKTDAAFFLIFLLFLFGLRIHAAIAMVAFNLILNYKKPSRQGGLLLTFSVIGCSIYIFYTRSGMIIHYLQPSAIMKLIVKAPYELLRFILSPLPTQISESLPSILSYWYAIGFLLSILSLFLFLNHIVKNKINSFIAATLGMTIVYLAPYIIIGNIGFRQQSIIAPLLFSFFSISTFIQFVSKHRLALSA